MRELHGAFTIFTLSLALVACNPPTTPTENVAPTTAVTLRVSFPGETGIRPLGTPTTAQTASVKVYDGNRLETTLRFESYSPTRTVNLKAGITYRFETSVMDMTGQEIAWGTRDHNVNGYAETVDLKFKSILGDAKLTSTPLVNGTVDVSLDVLGLPYNMPGSSGQPTAPMVPLGDFEATYTVVGGTVESSSNLGLRLRPAGIGNVTVTVQVSGLNKDHTSTILERTLTFAVTQPDPSTITGQVQNWMADKNLIASVQGNSNSNVTAVGVVGATGALDISLPDGSLATAADFNSLFTGVTWEVAPAAAQAITMFGFGLRADNKYIGDLELATRATGGQYVPGDMNAAAMVYVDRDVVGKGQSRSTTSYPTPVEQVFNFDFSLKKGWNLFMMDVKAVQQMPAFPGGPYPGQNYTLITQGNIHAVPYVPGSALPQGMNWYAKFENITDLAVEQVVDNTTPIEGNTVVHTVKVSNNGPSELSTYGMGTSVVLDLPKGLNWSYDGNCSFTSDYSGVTNGTLRCSVPTPMKGQSSTMSFRTTAEGLYSAPGNPITLTAKLDTQSYYDLEKANDLGNVIITRQKSSGSGTPTVDLRAPQVSFQMVGQLQAGLPVTLSGNVTDDGKVAKVEVYEGVHLLGTAVVNGTSWSYTWTPTTTGSFKLQAVAYDGAGNTGTTTTTAIVK
ncbi:Ig-like domain-containing protein [Deinococcus ficus]|uniref:Ig-like domain-containing protein n=1 Tax=Deinococcus ficus TaxID=317577 RepID=UPI0004030B2B|nr:Ig-like domain-containing protein [Deinococcus ficus]